MSDTIGTAVVRFKGDTKELDQSLSDVETKSKSVGGGLKGALAAGALAVSAAVATATAAIVSLGNESARAYGEFEQLEQGMQKIFDEVDYSTIKADALDAWQSMNLSARQYEEQITKIGANFATTMGDKKGYETAKQGMQALSDWATGTGQSVDYLMTKYQAISRSVQNYITIADQFAGILPQTKDDFLKQAQAAGFLSEQYEKLGDVPVVEYQQALTQMIEKGVKDANLLGNTAAETANTITGSLSGVKAAWDNLKVGFADPEANLEALTETFLNAAGNFAKQMIPAISRAIKGILKFLQKAVPDLVKQVPGMLSDLVPELIETISGAVMELGQHSQEITTLALQSALIIVNSIIQNLPTVLQGLVLAILGVVQSLTEPQNLQMMLQTFYELLYAVVDAIPMIISALSEALPDIVSNVVTFLADPETMKIILQAALTFWGAIVAAVPQIIGSLFHAFVKLFKDLATKLKTVWTDFAAKFGDGLGAALGNAINAAIGFIENVLNGPIRAVNNVIDAINDIPGVDIGHLAEISLPRVQLAQGGIAIGATNAIIGEAGKEAVIPLEQNTGNWSGLMAEALADEFDERSLGAGNVTIYMTNEINNQLDIADVSRGLAQEIRRAI